jgi:hypothetical protein
LLSLPFDFYVLFDFFIDDFNLLFFFFFFFIFYFFIVNSTWGFV